jgi:MarR family transcriptional regulator, organic hydroperoxide resistance regulator
MFDIIVYYDTIKGRKMNKEELARQISEAFSEIYYRAHPVYTNLLSHQAVRTLQLVHFQPGATIDTVAKHLGCAHNTASELVKRLAEKNLLTRQRRATDERSVELFLTPQGEMALYENTTLDIAKIAVCLQSLPDAESEQIVISLQLFLDKLKTIGEQNVADAG